jgi:hypothetical protein
MSPVYEAGVLSVTPISTHRLQSQGKKRTKSNKLSLLNNFLHLKTTYSKNSENPASHNTVTAADVWSIFAACSSTFMIRVHTELSRRNEHFLSHFYAFLLDGSVCGLPHWSTPFQCTVVLQRKTNRYWILYLNIRQIQFLYNIWGSHCGEFFHVGVLRL